MRDWTYGVIVFSPIEIFVGWRSGRPWKRVRGSVWGGVFICPTSNSLRAIVL